ncbi:MAG: hypothetical protein E7290_01370 [Lachnospiraceae bacterium]|nr:hypothetical protein [Lachnospiraceae bacterium]
MKKKLVLLALGISCSILVVGCGMGNKTEDPLTGEEMTNEQITDEPVAMEDNVVERDFDTVLGTATSPTEIIDYINTNIVGAAETDVRRFFEGLFNFGDNIRDIDFTALEQSRQHMPEDMIAFMDLMRLERDTPSMVMSDEADRMEIGMTLSEMLERALLFEEHIKKYPNHTSTQAATQLYEEILTAAISGGYDKTNNIPHYYQGETADVVDEKSIEYYEQFADANPDTLTGEIVNEYIQVLKDNKFALNDTVEEFYRNIATRVSELSNQPMGNDVTGTEDMTNGMENGTQNGTQNGTENGNTGMSQGNGTATQENTITE